MFSKSVKRSYLSREPDARRERLVGVQGDARVELIVDHQVVLFLARHTHLVGDRGVEAGKDAGRKGRKIVTEVAVPRESTVKTKRLKSATDESIRFKDDTLI